MSPVKANHLVLDSGPLIQSSLYPSIAEHFYTVPDVLSELKDQETRERLSHNPAFELTIKSPSAEAIRRVISFAKETGDYATLSSADIKVIALTLTLELEHNGEGRIRLSPTQSLIHESAAAGPKKPEKATAKPATAEDVIDESKEAGEWITPENISEIQSKHGSLAANAVSNPVQQATVACITTDFAMQNVLLQMRLRLYSPDGLRIKQLKNWLLRCHACYWTTTKEMDRCFCAKCGNPTLLRTSYMIDQQGKLHLFLKRNFQYNNRGTIYSAPLPKGGKHSHDLMLREDQREYQKALKQYERKEAKASKANDLDAIDDRLASVFGSMTVKGGAKLLSAGPPIIGFGRRNPNQVRRKPK